MMRKMIQLLAVATLLIPMLANAAPTNFYNAKIDLKEKVYFDQNKGQGGTAYCGCDWKWVGRSGGRIDLDSCGYKIRSPQSAAAVARAERTEVEHVFSISTLAHKRQCWKDGGRTNCRKVDPIFNEMEADLHGLLYISGELNGDASNYPMGVVQGSDNMYGQCTSKVGFKQRLLEPQDSAKGRVARMTFYGSDAYMTPLSLNDQKLLMQWHKQYPVTNQERMIERRTAKVMGHSNPYITGEKNWQLNMKLEGKQLKALNAKYPKYAQGQQSPQQHRQPAYQGRPAANQSNYQQAQQGSTSQAGATGFKGNSNSKIYHTKNCPNFGDVSPRNSVYFTSDTDAQSKGYRKARNCQ